MRKYYVGSMYSITQANAHYTFCVFCKPCFWLYQNCRVFRNRVCCIVRFVWERQTYIVALALGILFSLSQPTLDVLFTSTSPLFGFVRNRGLCDFVCTKLCFLLEVQTCSLKGN